jgi:hypothetical protein
MTEDANPKQDIGYSLLARIISVLVIASLIVVNDAVDRVEFQWHQKAAWWILTTFGFIGAVVWIRSTYTAEKLKAIENSVVVRVFWLLFVFSTICTMAVFLFGKLSGE